MEFSVTVMESERGWGSRIDEVRTFGSADEAWDYYNKINDENSLGSSLDLYWYAMEPQLVRK